jgi:hypothetical protein
MSDNSKVLKDMAAWGKETGKWILANPDKDWLTEYINAYGGEVTTQDEGGGDRPPIKPPNP